MPHKICKHLFKLNKKHRMNTVNKERQTANKYEFNLVFRNMSIFCTQTVDLQPC